MSEHRRLGLIMLMIAWVIIFVILSMVFFRYIEHQDNPNQHPQARSSESFNEVVLFANRQNHYVATGLINGAPVTFLVDTGATQVSIGRRLAEQLNLKPGLAGYAQTANGVVKTAQTELDSLTLGSIHLTKVPASITYSDSGDHVLLGMSALKDIELVKKSGQLTLRQPIGSKRP